VLTRRRLLLALAGLILIAIIVWFATRSGSAPQPAASVGISSDQLASIEERQRDSSTVIDYARLDRRLQALAERKAIVGLAVGIVENGEIKFLKGYGETVSGSGEKVGVDTVFRWASVSKGVAGDAVALLASQGKLALNVPVAQYRTTLRLPNGNENRATVADVLSHSLGLFGHANDSKLEDGEDPRTLRAGLASLNAICAPGQCHAYQNIAYDAASELVERATGETYQEMVRTRIFAPLGMNSASMSRDGLVTAKSWARPHTGGKGSKPVEVTEHYYRVPAAGGVNSSIKDLAIWMQAQMGLAPNVIPLKVLDEVQAERIRTPGELGRMRKFRERILNASYGLGWRVYDYAGHRVIGHRGGVRGYRSLVMFDRDRKSGVVALWNSATSQPGGVEFEVMDMLYGLEPRDWLGLDERPTPEQPQPEAMNASVSEGN
jgi:beta-lactamase class C